MMADEELLAEMLDEKKYSSREIAVLLSVQALSDINAYQKATEQGLDLDPTIERLKSGFPELYGKGD
jgi:hypothetical protein